MKKYIFIALLFALSGCATTDNHPTQANIDKANKYCEIQVNRDQQSNTRNWFTRWLECKKERVMPFDIKLQPDKEKEIRSMYERLISMGVNVDWGLWPVQDVYKEWDKMKAAIGMRSCLLRVENKDGSSYCLK